MDERESETTPMDLSALGPPVSASRLEAMVAAIVRRGEDELARRRGSAGVVRVVIAWRRPLLALSGLAAAAAVALIVRGAPASPANGQVAASSVAEALGIPAGYAESVEGSSRDGVMP
jgi:acyl-CoA reductase-like NAD-dependent aldehyde dehydrogenase